jgi:hypothetical protein
MDDYQRLLLEVRTARVRHLWAQEQVARGETTPALTSYVQESGTECEVLEVPLGEALMPLKRKK